MVRFDKYYYFDANEIAYVRKKNELSEKYLYQIFVGMKNGKEYGVSYLNEKDRDDEHCRLIYDIERERRQPTENLRWKLDVINRTLDTMDKRQKRIWRQLKDLLNLKEDETT